MSTHDPSPLDQVIQELRAYQRKNQILPTFRVEVRVIPPGETRPRFLWTVDAGVVTQDAPASTPPRVYKLDRVERAILQALGELWPEPMTLEKLAEASGYSKSTLTYAKRLGRLQDVGLVANRNDHQGYELTEEGQRIAADLLPEEPE